MYSMFLYVMCKNAAIYIRRIYLYMRGSTMGGNKMKTTPETQLKRSI